MCINDYAHHYACIFMFGCSLRQRVYLMCALLSAVCLSVCSCIHTNTPSRVSAAAVLPLVCQQAGLEQASRQALSLSGLCYHRGNSLTLIKASFNKGGICVHRAHWDLTSPTLYEEKAKGLHELGLGRE